MFFLPFTGMGFKFKSIVFVVLPHVLSHVPSLVFMSYDLLLLPVFSHHTHVPCITYVPCITFSCSLYHTHVPCIIFMFLHHILMFPASHTDVPYLTPLMFPLNTSPSLSQVVLLSLRHVPPLLSCSLLHSCLFPAFHVLSFTMSHIPFVSPVPSLIFVFSSPSGYYSHFRLCSHSCFLPQFLTFYPSLLHVLYVVPFLTITHIHCLMFLTSQSLIFTASHAPYFTPFHMLSPHFLFHSFSHVSSPFNMFVSLSCSFSLTYLE